MHAAHDQAVAATRSHPTALRHRKNLERLSVAQVDALRRGFAGVQAIGDDRGYAHWAGIHGLPLPFYCQHGNRLFLPWHRAYLYFFELTIRDQVPEAALVWWDWTSVASHTSGVPSIFAERRTGGQPNALYSAVVPPAARQNGQPRATTRQPASPTELPSAADVNAALALPDFLDFSAQLEDIHNSVHGWVGGTMGIIAWAAYDPIFWAHHTMIDRLWRLWQLCHPHAILPTSLLHQALPPFNMTVADTLDVSWLGYDYAAGTAHAVVA